MSGGISLGFRSVIIMEYANVRRLQGSRVSLCAALNCSAQDMVSLPNHAAVFHGRPSLRLHLWEKYIAGCRHISVGSNSAVATKSREEAVSPSDAGRCPSARGRGGGIFGSVGDAEQTELPARDGVLDEATKVSVESEREDVRVFDGATGALKFVVNALRHAAVAVAEDLLRLFLVGRRNEKRRLAKMQDVWGNDAPAGHVLARMCGGDHGVRCVGYDEWIAAVASGRGRDGRHGGEVVGHG